ncbi:hypothetical protein CYMTET_39166 [Cymbomonas tetramitiformis]|uniref:Uncharacterized protein n=1 Tax=Cymbomonas tetramitiformis TaxID=36881 RepID=A0AAE0F474_9CHLO|nr:hypothetical protein CYMTET_39166 [Cymbomonas tetramitiformis]
MPLSYAAARSERTPERSSSAASQRPHQTSPRDVPNPGTETLYMKDREKGGGMGGAAGDIGCTTVSARRTGSAFSRTVVATTGGDAQRTQTSAPVTGRRMMPTAVSLPPSPMIPRKPRPG